MALGAQGQRRITALTEAIESRRVLDDFWDQTLREALEEGFWNFAMRAIRIDASTTVDPIFGWNYAFLIPNDRVRTMMVSTVETFTPPLLDYMEEGGYWYANFTPLFIRHVSSDALYGLNLGVWPANFTKYISLLLAQYTCKKITGSDDLLKGPEGISRKLREAKVKAKSNDAMDDPPGQIPTGTWARSRRGFLRGLPLPGGTGYDD